ncbi:MAG: FAD-dependent oxidoreductase [Thermodesulfobacteriota bacterium]
MKKPMIFAIDDDHAVIRAIERDLRKYYGKDYRVIAARSGEEALESLNKLKLKSEEVAIFISDQRMPGMSGVDFLVRAKDIYPDAKRVLLTAYSDTDSAIRAINDVQLDYYLMKPWDPPEERLYPVINDLLEEWQASYKPGYEGIKVVGYQWSPRSHAVKEFLAGNLFPYQWLDIEINEKAKELLALSGLENADLPAVFFEDGSYITDPDTAFLGRKIGLRSEASQEVYDVVIIGAGPAGLAAAVYGASEGLKTLLVEKKAPGGQAGTSSRIENYLGFPNGLSGAELTRRAITQAKRLGAEFLTPQEVVDIQLKGMYKIIKLSDGKELNTLSVIIASGVDYRRLDAEDVNDFTGAGIYYGSCRTEAHACKGKEVYIVGGGNSAGQAAMYLSKFAKKVFILIRGKSLDSSMSRYLIEQISHTKNIFVFNRTQVVEVRGEGRLESLVLENLDSRERSTVQTLSLFIFIGTRPFTDWIKLNLIKNDKGYIETGRDLFNYENFKSIWKLERIPYLLESSIPGIFAAGDVRSGAMNRVASAVGEGSMAIRFTHEYINRS